MKLLLLSLFASPLLAQGPRQQSNLRQVTRPARSEYQTDLFTGTNLKEEQSTLNNSELLYTDRNGKLNFQPLGAQRAGEKGPLLIQDTQLLDTLATFNRERIPERIVHARGAGAHGGSYQYFYIPPTDI